MSNALKMLQDRVYQKDKLAREMTHTEGWSQDGPMLGYGDHGYPEAFALGVYRAPGEMMRGFDWLLDQSLPGMALDFAYPGQTQSADVVDELMNLAAVQEAYDTLEPTVGWAGSDLGRDMAEFGGMMVDPLAVGGAGLDIARWTAKGIPQTLEVLGKQAARGPIGRQVTQGMPHMPTPQRPPDELQALGLKAEEMFNPAGIDYDEIYRQTGVALGPNKPSTLQYMAKKEKGMIAGPNAANADLVALDRARGMKSAGAGADEIYAETGWWLDHPDGVPRFETDDSATRLLPINPEQAEWLVRKPATSGNEEPLGPIRNILDAPGAYEAYPDLGDIRVRGLAYSDAGTYDPGGQLGGGKTYPEGFEIGVEQVEGGGYKTPGKTKEVALHELQHAIQEREGMSKGGSPAAAPRNLDDSQMHDWYNHLAGEVEARSAGRRADMSAADRAANPFWKQDSEIPEEILEIDELYQSADINAAEMAEMLDNIDLPPELDAALRRYQVEVYDDFRNYGMRGDYEQYEDELTTAFSNYIEARKGPDVPYDQQILKSKSTGPAQVVPYRIEELQQVPMVAQTPLERAKPVKGKRPKSLDYLLGKRTENRMSEFAKRGDESGAGRAWYNLDPLRELFVDELGVMKGDEQFKRYTDFLAATSPREKVKQNVKRGSLFHYLERQGEPFAHLRNPGKVGDPTQEIPAGYGSLGHETQRHLLKDLEGGGHFSGLTRPKVSSFAENLAGNQWPITIDTHNISALTGGKWKRSPTPAEYGYIEKFEADIADKLGMTPAQFQASVWVGAGDETGVADVRPFLDVFNDVVVETAKKRKITPADALRQFIRGEKPLLGLAAAITGGTIAVETEDSNGDRS